MAYDIIRWIGGVILFAVILTVLCIISKKKGKAVVTAAFISIILTAFFFLVPVENYVHPFDDIETAFAYRYHEPLLTYFQCDEGVVCIAEKNDGSNINYCFNKDDGHYYLPLSIVDQTQMRSSSYGVFMIKRFDKQTIIFTQVSQTEYNGKPFSDGGMGYFYFVIDGNFNPSRLTCSGKKVDLV